MRLRIVRIRGDQSEGGLDDETVLRAAYDEHGRELFALAYRSLGDRGRAEEAVQETFLRAWRRADRFDPRRATLRTWLYAICRNVVIDAIRARAARPELADAAPPELPHPSVPSNNCWWGSRWRRRCGGCPISTAASWSRFTCVTGPPPRWPHSSAFPWAPSAVVCTTR